MRLSIIEKQKVSRLYSEIKAKEPTEHWPGRRPLVMDQPVCIQLPQGIQQLQAIVARCGLKYNSTKEAAEARITHPGQKY